MRDCHALKRTNTENWKQIFPEKELHGHSTVPIPYSCVCEGFIYSHDGYAYSAAVNMLTDPGII
jgi:hypothetical protein